jgi:hypothetical protein
MMILLQKVLDAHEEGAYCSFEPSTRRLVDKELRDMNKGKDLSFIRGTVEVLTKTGEILFKESNVSFGRFEREIINQVDWNKIWVRF